MNASLADQLKQFNEVRKATLSGGLDELRHETPKERELRLQREAEVTAELAIADG